MDTTAIRKRGEDNNPKTKTVSTALTWEIDLNGLCVREKIAPNSKIHGKNIPDFCVRIPACA